jgi:predicted nucleic acid-binding protein
VAIADSAIDQLIRTVERLNRQAREDLRGPLKRLQDAIRGRDDLAAHTRALELAARLSYYGVWYDVAAFQSAFLGLRVEAALSEVGAELAMKFGKLVSDRAVDTLRDLVTGEDIDYVARYYGDLVSDALTLEAARTGTQAAGTYHGATYKEFVRIRGAIEPRGHSALEGSVIPADATWNISGIDVLAPGDPALPLSERIHCGHVAMYLTEPPAGTPGGA